MNQLIDRVREDLTAPEYSDDFPTYYTQQQSGFSPQLYLLAMLHVMDGTQDYVFEKNFKKLVAKC